MRPTELQAAGATQAGLVREENQDHILISAHDPAGHGQLCVLADGMGGYAHGGVASRTAVEALHTAFYAGNPTQPSQNLRQGVQDANLEVHRAAQRLNATHMGTTLTALHIGAGSLALAHVGDSRAYLVRAGQARCLTNDHTVVGDLVRMKVLSSDQVRGHARRSVLSRSLGLNLFVQPDFVQCPLQSDDTLILCSDGVWAFVQDEEFAGLASAQPDPAVLSQQLIEMAMARASDDNVSAIAVRIHHPGSADAKARAWPWPAFLQRRRAHPSGGS
ncbi:MAG: protein phosphatase 2C domain-containing protein [Anaerolineales bacterium]